MNIARTLYASKNTEYEVAYTPDVVYAHRPGGDLTLQLVTPVPPALPPKAPTWRDPIGEKFARWIAEGGKPLNAPAPEGARFPLIVGCPGSGWAGADGHRYVPWLVELAKRGFAAASISYRGTYRDDVVFPAAVQDLREAVRFLKATADTWRVDPRRVGLLGDSSGGNTAALAALAGDRVLGFDDLSFDIGGHTDQDAGVRACCCVYGPVDLVHLVEDRMAEGKHLRPDEAPGLPFECMEIWQERYLADPERHLRAASPIDYIEDCERLPPFLYIQGDEDQIIPMAQGLRFCDRLRARGGRAEFIKVVGGEHGAGVWSAEMLDSVARFFKVYL